MRPYLSSIGYIGAYGRPLWGVQRQTDHAALDRYGRLAAGPSLPISVFVIGVGTSRISRTRPRGWAKYVIRAPGVPVRPRLSPAAGRTGVEADVGGQDFAATRWPVRSLRTMCTHLTAALMWRPRRSARTGAGRPAARRKARRCGRGGCASPSRPESAAAEPNPQASPRPPQAPGPDGPRLRPVPAPRRTRQIGRRRHPRPCIRRNGVVAASEHGHGLGRNTPKGRRAVSPSLR
jgi:hypothetical protein